VSATMTLAGMTGGLPMPNQEMVEMATFGQTFSVQVLSIDRRWVPGRLARIACVVPSGGSTFSCVPSEGDPEFHSL